jgi:hypothetical protein
MNCSKYENGVSYYTILRKIVEFADRHVNLDSKQEREDNLHEMLLYTMGYPEFINYYDEFREAILDHINSNYQPMSENPEFLKVCADWVAMFGDIVEINK